MTYKSWCCLFCLLLVWQIQAQEAADSISSVTDRALRQEPSGKTIPDTNKVPFFKQVFSKKYPNPERAAAMSFILPGSGQIYNKRLWWLKVPVIYGGYAAFIYAGETNRNLGNRYQTAYLASLAGEPHEFDTVIGITSDRLRNQRNIAQKNYQLSYIGLVVLHLVQALEAYTSGHLLEFDMDESLTVRPTLLDRTGLGFGESRPGLTMTVQLGR